ncbi:MAG: hypothetical protein QW540_10195 [Archaeoglobaceae archaeon]
MFEVVFDFEDFKQIAKTDYLRYLISYQMLNDVEAIVRLRIYALHKKESHIVVYEEEELVNQFDLKEEKLRDAIKKQIDKFRQFAEGIGAKEGYFSLNLNPDE